MDNDDNQSSDAINSNEESFADMFEKSFKKQGRLEPGQMVEAMIVKITPEWIFLDLGGKGEGYLARKEMIDEAGNLAVKEGDTVRAYFLSSGNNEMHFTTKIGAGPAGHAQIEDAWRNGVPVEGTVTKEVKGGFEVKIAGSARAFCPFSQMGIGRGGNQGEVIGKALSFNIIEYSERNIVLSRKAILDQEKRNRKLGLKETLKEGMKVKGTVTSIQNFGAFVDVGGVEGLLPASEIAWSRTEKVGDVLSVGQEVEVVVKKLDWEQDRFSFSLKDALPNPWDRVADAYPAGSFHTGKVARLAPFGAFVTLAAGVDGHAVGGSRPAHPRELPRRRKAPDIVKDVVAGLRRVRPEEALPPLDTDPRRTRGEPFRASV